MKKYLFLIFLCIFLGGCIGQPSSNDTTEAQLVEDPFAETSSESISPENPVPSWELPGVTLHGYAGEMPQDDLGTYLVYEGCQMHLQLALQARGLSTAGVGVLLFLDGQPQPFSLEENGAYEYMHIVYPGPKRQTVLWMRILPRLSEMLVMYWKSPICSSSILCIPSMMTMT